MGSSERKHPTESYLIARQCTRSPWGQRTHLPRWPDLLVYFLPPNVTSLVPLMDQGVLGSLKWCYKRHLLNRLMSDEAAENEGNMLPRWKKKIYSKDGLQKHGKTSPGQPYKNHGKICGLMLLLRLQTVNLQLQQQHWQLLKRPVHLLTPSTDFLTA